MFRSTHMIVTLTVEAAPSFDYLNADGARRRELPINGRTYGAQYIEPIDAEVDADPRFDLRVVVVAQHIEGRLMLQCGSGLGRYAWTVDLSAVGIEEWRYLVRRFKRKLLHQAWEHGQ